MLLKLRLVSYREFNQIIFSPCQPFLRCSYLFELLSEFQLNQWQPGIMPTMEITSIIMEHPVEAGPYGAKGVGEISSIPTTPAITNAIYNAVGVRIDKLPVDQEVIAREIWEREEVK